LQRESHAPQSFAQNQEGKKYGVTTTIAGRETIILLQARDRFANLQGYGGDPFFVHIKVTLLPLKPFIFNLTGKKWEKNRKKMNQK
jgi:hypothetical protein